MRELFYEESANIIEVDKERKKYTVLNIFSKLFYVIFGVSLFIEIFFLFDLSVFKTNFLTVLLYILLYIGPIVTFFLTAFFLGKFRNKYYNEYDYTLVSGSIRISKVIMNKKRKFLFRFEGEDIERIGKYGSPEYERYISMPNIKTKILTSNTKPNENKDFYFIVAVIDGDKTLMLIECTENLIASILQFTNITVLERVRK